MTNRMIPIPSIRAAAWSISITATLILVVVELFGGSSWEWILLKGLITLFVVFGVSYLFIRQRVLHKLKPIYEIVTGKSKQTSAQEFSRMFSVRDDMIRQVNDELIEWGKTRDSEIDQLREDERFRREFMGNVSHELKTPVFTLQGYVQTLLDGALEDQEINRLYLQRAEKNIERLVHVIADLDEISKFESGESVPECSVFDLRELLREVIDEIQYEAVAKRVKIEVEPHGSAPVWVCADRMRIGQVLTNLLSNTFKYGKPGGGVTVVRFVDMFDKVMVEVQDDGIGIAKEHQWRVFERFFRVDKSRSREQGGTGLGLSIVKHILDSHHESILLRSELGSGSTFSFSLSKPKRDNIEP